MVPKSHRSLLMLLVLLWVFPAVLAYDLDLERVGNWPEYDRGSIEHIRVRGNYAYCAAGPGGLVIFDISAPEDPRPVGRNSTVTVKDLALEGQFAFAASETFGFAVFDVSNPTDPRLVAEVAFPPNTFSQTIQLSGSYAILQCSRNVDSLPAALVDIGNPLKPRLVNFLTQADSQMDFLVWDKTLYVPSEFGIEIFDLTDPATPRRLTTLSMGGASIRTLAREGNLLCAGTDSGELYVYDVRDGSNPVLITVYSNLPVWRVVLAKSMAYVLEPFDTMTILDLTDPAQPRRRGNYKVPNLNIEAITVHEGTCYLSIFPFGLQVVNVRDPDRPQLSGRFEERGYTKGVVAKGGFAYVADGPEGVKILDVHNPGRPRQVGRFQTDEEAGDIILDGSVAYVAAGTNGLVVLDVAEPSNPKLMATLPAGGFGSRLDLAGHLIYLVNYYQDLQVTDVSNASDPRRIGSYRGTDPLFSVTVSNQVAFVGTARGMEVLDVADASFPVRRAFFRSATRINDVKLRGEFAYLADASRGLQVLDIKNPFAPRSISLQSIGPGARRILLNGTYAYVSSGMDGIYVYDITDPYSPRQIGSYDAKVTEWSVSGIAEGLSIEGDFLYLADWSAGLHILDIRKPANPQTTVRVPQNSVGAIAQRGDRAYAAVGGALGIIDTSKDVTGRRLISLENIQQPQIANVVVDGKFCFLAQEGAGLDMVDISTEDAPRRVGRFTATVPINDVAVASGLAFAAAGSNGLVVLDVADPLKIAQLGASPGYGNAKSISIQGGFAYIASEGEGIRVIAIDDPANPSNLSVLPMDGTLADIHVEGRLAGVAAKREGLQLVDISDPAAPRKAGSYKARSEVDRVYIHGKYAYLGVGLAGIEVLDVERPEAPVRVGGCSSFGYVFSLSGDAQRLCVGTSEGVVVTDLFRLPGLTVIAQDGKDTLTLELNGPRGVPLRLHRSTDLKSWQPLQEITVEDTAVRINVPTIESAGFFRAGDR